MAFLDWVKNRGQAVSAPANDQGGPGPETAKQYYTREAAQEKESQPKVTSLDAATREKVSELGGKINTLAEPSEQKPTATPAPTSAPATNEGADNQQPMKQVSMSQDKEAPALSPTSAQLGMKDVQGPEPPKPTPTPPKPSRSMSPDF